MPGSDPRGEDRALERVKAWLEDQDREMNDAIDAEASVARPLTERVELSVVAPEIIGAIVKMKGLKSPAQT